jgi:hypothetical protein
MDLNKRQRLEASGWQIGTVENFLELSEAEAKIVELKLSKKWVYPRKPVNQQSIPRIYPPNPGEYL